MTTLPEKVLASKSSLEEGADVALKDGLRILARIIARAYLESNKLEGKKEEMLDWGGKPKAVQHGGN